jgi:hypothetical protein
MPYYPTFAFFNKNPQIRQIAQSLVLKLGEELSEISFETDDMPESKVVSFEKPEKAIRFLKRQETDITRLWLASDLHSLEFSLVHRHDKFKGHLCEVVANSENQAGKATPTTTESYLSVYFWDFGNEVYDSDEPTQSMQTAKRDLAIMLHKTLIEHCDVRFSYTSSTDNKYSGQNDHFDTSDVIFDAIQQRQFLSIVDVLKNSLYFWLVGFAKTTKFARVIEKKLHTDFREVCRGNISLIFEHKENKPYFLL